MRTILIASGNPGKLREIQSILGSLPVKLMLPVDMGVHLHVEETGDTYAENAALKAAAYFQHTGLVTLADDSGLEVDALDGLPGIRSARFSPVAGATDADRRSYLLERLKDLPRPWLAHFHCTVALAAPGRSMSFADGDCPGEITPEERGHNGFGYDPIFWLPELGKTMAELPEELKNRLSHRGRALLAILPVLTELINEAV
jgi:XTP/dITP diphosphohydrolase